MVEVQPHISSRISDHLGNKKFRETQKERAEAELQGCIPNEWGAPGLAASVGGSRGRGTTDAAAWACADQGTLANQPGLGGLPGNNLISAKCRHL